MADKRRASDRFLTTVLMTDIVGSTEHSAELGDTAWRELVGEHNSLVRSALRRHGGREIDTAGDGFFAAFDAPAAAIECALEVVSEVDALGLAVRAGVHVGEVEQIGQKVGGIAVPIAARIMSLANGAEVLVSGTARDLAAGAGLTFADRGSHTLKGVPGEWHLFAAVRPAVPQSAVDAVDRRNAAVRRARSRPVWQRRPRIVAGAFVGAVVIALVAGLLVWKPWQPPALSSIGENAVGIIDEARSDIVGSIDVGSQPGGVAVADGVAWVTNTGADSVTQIDVASHQSRKVIDVGRGPLGIVASGGSLWVANSAGRTLTRINAETARVVGTIEVGNGPLAVAAFGGSVWVANFNDSTAMRIDAVSGATTVTVPVAAGPVALAADASGIWIASADAAAITHLDGQTGATLAPPIPLSSRPTAIATGAGAVWVAGADGTVTRIDSQQHRVTATVDVGGSLAGIVAGATTVWVADRLGFVASLDSADPTGVIKRIPTASAPEALTVTGGQVWVTARAAAASHRGGILRIASTSPPSQDPAGKLLYLTGDGLVGYRRVGGAAGATFVADLATSVPRPTDGGLTYTFQLRPGLIYSTGEPVQAADFRRAAERSFEVIDPLFGEAFGNFYFVGLVGAEACATADRSAVPDCDLSAGITTDETARVVAFHLTEPDANFLGKLTSSAAFPIAASVPAGVVSDAAIPGTGPYVIASSTDTETRLVRNSHFERDDPDSRPDGFPDEIVWTVVAEPADAVGLVERGEADLTRLTLENRIEPAPLAALAGRYPAQFHFASNSITSVTMNTLMAPFDQVEVRQAVNMAIDRAHVVDLRGGSAAAAVTCQVLPPGWPGYRPYCPYTTHPDAGGRWQAPDLDAARRLIDASGARGAKVVVGPVLPPFADARDYLATVLQDLGFDVMTDTETEGDYVFNAHFDENRVQISVWEWFAGELSAASLLDPFVCGKNEGTTNFCDPAYDAVYAEAHDLEAVDPARAAEKWAAAERMIVDEAVWAPLFSEGSDFVSTRVGNYQFHYFYLALLDQMWVQ